MNAVVFFEFFNNNIMQLGEFSFVSSSRLALIPLPEFGHVFSNLPLLHTLCRRTGRTNDILAAFLYFQGLLFVILLNNLLKSKMRRVLEVGKMFQVIFVKMYNLDE